VGLVARAGVAVAGLALAFRLALPEDGAIASLAGAWKVPLATGLLCFAGAFSILGASLLVGALRFRGLLRGADLEIELGTLLRAYLVAAFFNLVLPGAMLGDVYRFFDARRDTGEGSRVLAIVALERVLSLAALGSIALLVAPVIPSLHGDRRLLVWLVAAGAGFVALAVALLAPPVHRGLRRLAARFSARADHALGALGRVASRRGVVARAYAWSLLNQALPVLALAVLAVPLDALVPWYWFAVIVPFVTLVSLLPISIGGTGVRELLYVSLFGAVGMPAEAALLLSLSVLAAALLWGLVGLAIFTLGRRDAAVRATPAAEA
jgi:uncharacterized membrane protein YbhN (UPF0104 family)